MKLEITIKSPVLDELLMKVNYLLLQGEKQMALGQEILDAVTAEGSAVDSIIALLNGLVASNVIDSTTANSILTEVAENKAKLEAAILANTGPAPTP